MGLPCMWQNATVDNAASGSSLIDGIFTDIMPNRQCLDNRKQVVEN